MSRKSGIQSNNTERRRKFSKWISVPMLRSLGKLPFFLGDGTADKKITNIMSNADRRARGYEQDPDLEDYQQNAITS